MSKKVLILTAIVLVSSAHAVEAEIVHSTWVGGEDGRWGDASNWSPAIVPDNTPSRKFAVTIDSNSIGVGDIEVRLQQNRTIDRLDSYGKVELLCWPLSMIQLKVSDPVKGLTNHGTFNIDDEFWVAGNITNFGELEIEAGAEVDGNVANYNAMQISEGVEIVGNITNASGAIALLEDAGTDGNLYNAADANLTIEGNVDVWDGGLENAGFIMVKLGADLWAEQYFRNIGHIQLMGGSLGRWPPMSGQAIIDNNSTGTIAGFGTVEAKQLIQNKGTIHASSGSLLLYSEGSVTNTGTLGNSPVSSLHIKPAEDVNNLGTIEVNAGGGLAFDCNMVNEPNAVIKLLGGIIAAKTITQKANATFKGQGEITTANLIIETKGLIQLTGPANIFGNVQIVPNATLEISDGTTVITGHTTCNGTIHMKGGRIIPQGGLSGDCNIIWEPGIYTNIADFNLDGTVNFKDFVVFADSWLWQTSWH